jgi:hypothetical protein
LHRSQTKRVPGARPAEQAGIPRISNASNLGSRSCYYTGLPPPALPQLDTPGRCAIEDRGWRRRIVIEEVGAASSVVWNPWAEKAAAMVDLGDPAWRGMVCVETGNVADNEVRLAADDEHQMSTVISVDAGP